MKSGRFALRPRTTPRPGPVFQPRDVPRQVPAIDDEVGAANYRERGGVLCNEQKRYQVEKAMYQRRQRALGLLDGHPFALQQIIAYGVGY